MNGIYPVLSNLYLLRLGYGVEFVGLVNACGLLGYALAAFPAGLVSNRLGMRCTMALGMGMAAVLYGLQPLIEPDSIPIHKAWLLASRAVAAVGFALFFVNSAPFLIAATGPEERNYAYSMRGMVDTLSGFFGSLLGGVLPGWLVPVLNSSLDEPGPYRFSIILAAALCVPAVWILLSMRTSQANPPAPEISPAVQDVPSRDRRSVSATLQTARKPDPAPLAVIVVMALVVMLRSTGVGVSRTFFNVYLDDGLGISIAQIGTLFAAGQLVAASGGFLMPVLTGRWGNYRVVLWGSLGIAAGLLPVALIPHWGAALLGRIAVYTLALITDATVGVYQMESVSLRWRSAMAGAVSMALGLSWTAFAFGGGYLISALSYRALFLSASAFTAAGALLFGFCFRRRQNDQHQDSQRLFSGIDQS